METVIKFIPWEEAVVPEVTDTYQPIAHIDLLNLIYERLDLYGYRAIRNNVQQSNNGERIAATIITQRNDHEEMTLMLGVTNSYDKSLAIKLASGASVFICENGMVVGDVVTFRKHTSRMMDDLTEMIDKVVNNLETIWKKTVIDVALMQQYGMTDEAVAELYGRLFIIEDVVTSTELNIAVKELKKPTFVEFEPKTLWSAYNHITFALKNAPPHRRLDCLKRLHEVCMDIADDWDAIGTDMC